MLESIDINKMLESIDINKMLESIDINKMLESIDINKMLESIDINKMLESIDIIYKEFVLLRHAISLKVNYEKVKFSNWVFCDNISDYALTYM